VFSDIYEKQKQIKSDHDILTTKNNIALVLAELGEYQKAFEICKSVYEERMNVLRLNHPNTLASKHNMAIIMANLGKHQESIKLLKEVHEKQSEQFGADHPFTINTSNSIASISKTCTMIGKIIYYPKAIIGRGSMHTIVYHGFYENKKI